MQDPQRLHLGNGSARSNYVLEEIETYTVEPDWEGNNIAEISFADESLTMASSGGSSTTVTITNLANSPISGDIYLLGSDVALFDVPFLHRKIITTYTLSNGQTAEFRVLLISRISETEDAMLRISANVSIGGNKYTRQSSNQLSVYVVGPELPPNGVELPLGIEFDEQQTITALGSGWGLALLLILVNILRKRRRWPLLTLLLKGANDENKPEKARK